MKFPVFILALQHCKLILPRFIGWRRSRGDRPTVFAARWGHRALPMGDRRLGRLMTVSLFYGSSFLISVPRFPRLDVDAALGIYRLKTPLQLNDALDLFRIWQVGKIAAPLRLCILFFRKWSHRRHFPPSSAGQTSPWLEQIAAKAFLSNRSEARNACTRSLSFTRPV